MCFCDMFDVGKNCKCFGKCGGQIERYFGYIGGVAIMKDLSRMLQLMVPE